MADLSAGKLPAGVATLHLSTPLKHEGAIVFNTSCKYIKSSTEYIDNWEKRGLLRDVSVKGVKGVLRFLQEKG